ncbi:MAG: PASTA domain-containing protein [Lachnospiraceae bacterium]|nr:PASTA domain-containing protein [Lachnospiraceae bacterium]
MLEIGTFLGDRYEILELIGSGGMADVYKAKCHKLNRFVAIKVLKPEFSSDSGFVSKFKAEAQAAAGLMHPNIVNVYDVGEERRMYYFVMELVEGITLKHYIEKKIRLTSKEAVSIAIQVSMGIEAAHNNGIIHRDIKPQNIIISKEGKVKVADFGIAKAATSNTVTSHAMGSVHYTSPEQARGGYSDAKSDIYSIGITLFEMVTGHVPFDGETTVAVAIKHIQEEMPSPRIYVPDVPISVEQIISKCCQKNPDRRYANVGQLIRDLKHSLTNPDEEFVVFSEPASEGGTKNISDQEKIQIRNQTAFVNTDNIMPIPQEEPRPAPRKASYEQETDDAYEDDYEDVFGVRDRKPPKTRKEETRKPAANRNPKTKNTKPKKPDRKDYYEDELDDDVDPKMEKAVTILLVVAAIIITIIAIVVIGKVFGAFSGDSSDGGEELTIETSSSSTAIVPNVVGMTVAEAGEALTKAGLTAKATYKESTEYDKDYIVSQDIEGNTEVPAGTVLNLVVSSGKIVGVNVPDVVGLSEAEAKVMLENEGFAMQKQLQESDTVEKGNVISQNPLGATTAAKGSPITVVISSGKNVEQITMPDLTGKTEEEAKVVIEEEGLSIGTVAEENSDTVEKGKVTSQSPAAGGMVDKGTAVDLKVSLGKKTVSYSCSVDVGAPANFMEGSEAVIVLLSPAGEELGRFSTTTFPYNVSKKGINDISSGAITITYLSAEGTWETTNPTAVTFTAEE